MPFLFLALLFVGSVTGSYAETPEARIVGDSRVVFSPLLPPAEIHYCLQSLQTAGDERPWRLLWDGTDLRAELRSTSNRHTVIPFEVAIRHLGSRRQRVPRTGEVIISGRGLSAHCQHPGSSFSVQVIPQVGLDRMARGEYWHVLRFRLVVGEKTVTSHTVELLAHIFDRVRLKAADSIELIDRKDGMGPVGLLPLCVFRNGAGGYRVRLHGEGPGGAFVLDRGGQALPYEVLWQGQGETGETLQPHKASGLYRGAQAPDCQANSNASLQLQVPATAARQAQAGRYQGILRITVEVR